MEWISVNDRLPESNITVIIAIYGFVDIGWYDEYTCLWQTDEMILHGSGVTHWMPLPEPPPKEDA